LVDHDFHSDSMTVAPAPSDRLIRLGVVGAGRWGRNIIKTIASLHAVELAGVASGNPDTQKLVPAGCRVVGDWRDLIDRVPMDGVVIATPPATHFPIAKASIDAGLHALIEKPLSLDLEEAEEILSLARGSHRVVMTEFTQLFNPKFRALLGSLPVLNGVQSILTRAGNFGPVRTDTPVLWDWGAHELSMLITLAGGEPISIAAERTAQGRGGQGDESSWSVACRFQSDIRSESAIGNMMPRCRKVAVFGASGALLFDDVGDTPLSYHAGHRLFAFPESPGEPIAVEDTTPPLTQAIVEFSQAIRRGDVSLDSVSIGVAVVRQLSLCARKD
jgi:predicted dehydrogenase